MTGARRIPFQKTIIALVVLLALAPASAATGAIVQVKLKEAIQELQVGLTLELPTAETLGHYSGPVRMAVGEVVDAGYAETDDFLGVGPNAAYRVTLATTRTDSLRRALTEVMAMTGLAPATLDAADYVVDATIRRDRFSYDGDRLRSEVIVEFDFRQAAVSAGRVMVYGNAETPYSAQYDKSLKVVHALYESALHDMLYKLVASDVFRQLVGEDWAAGSPPVPLAEGIGHIDQSMFYLPTEHWAEVDELAAALGGRDYERLIVQDFEILDKEFLKKAHEIEQEVCGGPPKRSKAARIGKGGLTVSTLGLNKLGKRMVQGKKNVGEENWPCDSAEMRPELETDVAGVEEGKKGKKKGLLRRYSMAGMLRDGQSEDKMNKKAAKQAGVARIGTWPEAALRAGVRPRRLACECLPGLVREHLEAYYPQAFATVEHRAAWEPAEALVITGEVRRFNMGRGSTRLEADVLFKDGMSGETLYSFPVEMGEKMMNWKTGVLSALMTGVTGGSMLWVAYNVPPAMRDMEDDVGRSVAYMLVESLRPDYAPPADLEIAFDERSRLATALPPAEPGEKVWVERGDAPEPYCLGDHALHLASPM